MSHQHYHSGHTTNDLLERRIAEHTSAAPNDLIVAQSAEEEQSIENVPSISDVGYEG